MGWSKIDVDGRVMWESPDGQRVADPADIPGMGQEMPTRTFYRTISGMGIDKVVALVALAFAIGMVVGDSVR